MLFELIVSLLLEIVATNFFNRVGNDVLLVQGEAIK